MWGFQMKAKDALPIWKRNPCLTQTLPRYPFQGFLPSAPLARWTPIPMGRRGRGEGVRGSKANGLSSSKTPRPCWPQPLWMLHNEALIPSGRPYPDPHPSTPTPTPASPGPGNNGSSLSFLSLDSHFQISALEARYPPEDFYIELRHLSRHAEPHSPG